MIEYNFIINWELLADIGGLLLFAFFNIFENNKFLRILFLINSILCGYSIINSIVG